MFMIEIDVLFCMEMVIDGGKETVIGGDIRDDFRVIWIVICIGLGHVICNCPGYDNREKIYHHDL